MSDGWNTIESDAGVFTHLVESLGVEGVQFEEIISLDAEDLARLHPVYGLIFLFKFPTDAPYTTGDAPPDGHFARDAAESLFFSHQTIQNACATQALLSVLLNKTTGSSSDTGVEIGPQLAEFREFAMALPYDLRGEALSNSELIRTVHNSFAKSSPFVDETRKPDDAEAEDAFHFVAYTCVDGALLELDGLQPYPVTHGVCTQATFAERVMDVIQRRIARYDETEIRFNLLAVVRDLRERAREFGDLDALAAEEEKRVHWRVENALRTHNFVGLTGEVLAAVVDMKLEKGGEPAYREWMAEALQRMARERKPGADKPGNRQG